MVLLRRGWGEISLEDGDVDAVRGNYGHRSMGHLPLKRATMIVVSADDCCTGEDSGIKVILRGSRGTRCARRGVW